MPTPRLMNFCKFPLILLPLFIMACQDPCALEDPKPPETAFVLLDQSGHSLIGEGRRYNPDSINHYHPDMRFNVGRYRDTIIFMSFAGLQSGEMIKMQYGAQDFDSLRVFYNTRRTDCFNVAIVYQIMHNGQMELTGSQWLHRFYLQH